MTNEGVPQDDKGAKIEAEEVLVSTVKRGAKLEEEEDLVPGVKKEGLKNRDFLRDGFFPTEYPQKHDIHADQ